MTKKDYELIAASFAFWVDGALPRERRVLYLVASVMSKNFPKNNPNFDRFKFLTACGFGIEVERYK